MEEAENAKAFGGRAMDQETFDWDDPKPGFEWPVAAATSVTAPVEDLWKAISSPGSLENCHPFCSKNPVWTWPGPSSRDEVHYLNGLVFERRFRRWLEGIGYDLEIGRPGGSPSYVAWRVQSLAADESMLRIVVYPHPLQRLPSAIRWLSHVAWLRPMLTHCLSSVVNGFPWYVEKGERVPRNQFGVNRWFSVPVSDRE